MSVTAWSDIRKPRICWCRIQGIWECTGKIKQGFVGPMVATGRGNSPAEAYKEWFVLWKG